MPRAARSSARVAVAVAVAVALAGCIVPGETVEESRSVGLDGARELRVDVRMPAGGVVVTGGGTGALDGDFTYNVDGLAPVLDYGVDDGVGHLSVRAEGGAALGPPLGEVRADWTLRLASGVPMTLRVEHGAGTQSIDMRGADVMRVDIESGAGESHVDLRDTPRLERVDVAAGVGELVLDLRGERAHDVDAALRTGVGRTTLHLPEGVGVRVTVSGGLGNVDAEGFTREGDAYANDAWGRTDASIRLDVQAGVGELRLRLS